MGCIGCLVSEELYKKWQEPVEAYGFAIHFREPRGYEISWGNETASFIVRRTHRPSKVEMYEAAGYHLRVIEAITEGENRGAIHYGARLPGDEVDRESFYFDPEKDTPRVPDWEYADFIFGAPFNDVSYMVMRILLGSGATEGSQYFACRKLFRCSHELAHHWPQLVISSKLDCSVEIPPPKVTSVLNREYPRGELRTKTAKVTVSSGPALDTTTDQRVHFIILSYGRPLKPAKEADESLAAVVSQLLESGDAMPIDFLLSSDRGRAEHSLGRNDEKGN